MRHVPLDQETLIRPTRGWFELNLADVWRYRDLLLLLVHRDFIAKYKQTVLGPAWFVFQPLLMTVVFSVVFGRVMRIPTEGLPPFLFYLAGLLSWTYFAQTFQNTANTLIANAGIFGKVYFPRLVVPLAAAVSNLLAFGLQLATLLCAWVYFKFFTVASSSFGFSAAIAWLPLLVLQLAALSLGAGLWLSAVTVKYRDFNFLTPFIVQVWMYATPVIYPFSQIPERWRLVAVINPMTMPTEAIKLMFLGRGVVTPAFVVISLGVTMILLASGVLVFNKVEKTFVDIV
jgi:lipopolysaccharide transport system permease protein